MSKLNPILTIRLQNDCLNFWVLYDKNTNNKYLCKYKEKHSSKRQPVLVLERVKWLGGSPSILYARLVPDQVLTVNLGVLFCEYKNATSVIHISTEVHDATQRPVSPQKSFKKPTNCLWNSETQGNLDWMLPAEKCFPWSQLDKAIPGCAKMKYAFLLSLCVLHRLFLNSYVSALLSSKVRAYRTRDFTDHSTP